MDQRPALDQAVSDSDKPESFLYCLNDPFRTFAGLVLSFPARHKACFILCNAGTGASEIEGISAAGADPQARRLTPALDAEALVLGRTVSASRLPVSPAGIVSPVVITRACLELLQMETKVIDCGSFHTAAIPQIQVSRRVAQCPSTGKALPEDHVQKLFKRGLELGDELCRSRSHLVVAECVPGGTTTALALLTALGFAARGLVSSSLPDCNHETRYTLIEKGFTRAEHSLQEMREQPLLAVAAFGDPMQVLVSGIVSSASRQIPVYLAGGSQMLAVWALIRALSAAGLSSCQPENIFVLTTRWVAFDRSAGVIKLAEQLDAPFAAANPDFSKSRHAGLRAYEEGNVKEGVGAGASMCLARIAGFNESTIMAKIDDCYDKLLCGCPTP